ncbi:LOW QUALITY PROTEIN: protein TIC 100-like [Hibiscus syriacus]|uniref:LOW QUALITY PROTEIN: protein TIC 100-like n=1 Tax=Hibiscus syriacus TaxID=106335 RepID=UPI001921651C|nr:LOW QUALITY PROTEIN: protein TIC 100-like [Hibiscus syriacus]
MSNDEEQQLTEPRDPEDEDDDEQGQQLTESQLQYPESDSDSDSSSSSDDYIEESDSETVTYTRPGEEPPESETTPEANIRRFTRVLESKRFKRLQEEDEEEYVYYEDLWDFPPDPENWREEDLQEHWVDAPLEMTKPGWDPVWADEEDWEIVRDEIKEGRDPGIAPFYVPYRKPFPAIPEDHYDISNPKAVIEELDRIEEFLKWVSYIFPDGSSYEGTVWDDLAHGKGVYVAEQGLVRYEGEWLQNNMEGHGIVHVDIPDIEPVPGSKLEAKMRAEGKIISRDFMTPEDKEWLEMDVEDSTRMADGQYEIPFYENDIWIKHFGRKPEKGRYRYAGQWKHGRMHGCGVYEVNERTIYGRFYFGELLQDSYGCDENTSAMHAGIAEVAAAKARMFVNKPDGMVREERGPYGDPQHPYLYEEDDVWMAPGFINQFYEVPDYWKTYVHEVDQEREMWLNSFYKAPLRLPMPAELEYWWSKDETPEFILINKEPEPDPEDPSKLIYTEDPLILHTPTGRLINYIEDEEHGVRLFWQPPLKVGEEIDEKEIQFLPLGFDEFYGREVIQKRDNIWKRLITAIENALKPGFDKLEKWTEEKRKAGALKMELIEKELDHIEAELCLEEAIEDLDEELKKKEEEEEKKMKMGLLEDEEDTSVAFNQEDKVIPKDDVEKGVNEEEEEEDDDDDDDDDVTPSSFGSVASDQKGKKPREPPFFSSSLSFASCSLVSAVPSTLRESFLSLKQGKLPLKSHPPSRVENFYEPLRIIDSVSFPPMLGQKGRLRAFKPDHQKFQPQSRSSGKKSQLHSLCKILSCPSTTTRSRLRQPQNLNHFEVHAAPEKCPDSILSLHMPVCYLETYGDTIRC